MDQYDRYAGDSSVLAAIGRALRGQPPAGPVRIPRELAVAAAAAWSRDELDDLADPESEGQRLVRGHAAVLALIGLAVQEGADTGGDPVLVSLGADLIAEAVAAGEATVG